MEKSLFAMDGVYARVMNWFWNILVISVLWVLCCIPIVTIGASCTAAYYTAAKVIRGKAGRPIPEFFHAFKTNFRQSLPFSVLYVLVTVILLLECYYFYNDSQISLPVLYLFYGMVLVTVANAQYLFACLSRFSMTKFQFFRMATLCSFRHLISSILLLVLGALTVIGVYLMPWGILVFPGLAYLAKTYIMERVLRKYTPDPESEEEEQKWYYNIK